MWSADAPAVEVDDLVKRYRKAKVNAVDGITLEVRAGEFFALLGPNGAGKTTTISILTTTLAPTGGRPPLDRRDLLRGASAGRRLVGIIFQKPRRRRNPPADGDAPPHA